MNQVRNQAEELIKTRSDCFVKQLKKKDKTVTWNSMISI